jgi:hypothetical protein
MIIITVFNFQPLISSLNPALRDMTVVLHPLPPILRHQNRADEKDTS